MARKRSVHKPEPRKERPRIFLCEEHRRAFEQLYYLDETGAEEWGRCFGCMKTAWGRLYTFEPRKAHARPAGAGGGERAKAAGG